MLENVEDNDLKDDKVGQRLRAFRSQRGMNLKVFYKPLGNPTNWSAIENGNRNLGKRLFDEVTSYYNINPEWLLSGRGEMVAKLEDASAGSENTSFGVPFFNVNLSEITFGETGMFREPPEYYVNFRPFNDCDAFLPIYGDSMYPKYASGEMIAIREIRNFDVIQWGEAYLVVADESANNITTVKLIFEHADPEKIILRSSNPNFKGDTILHKSVLQRMFLVKGKVTRNQL